MLEVCAVSKVYPNKHRAALESVSFSVPRGELLVLLGESGCGKTTLLRILAGLESPDSGNVAIDGRIVAGDGAWVAPEARGVGFVFQGGALFPHLKVLDNVAYGLSKLRAQLRRAVAAEMLELVGLPEFGQRYPHELSAGERQRIALARALAPHPQMVLLDEPFSNLDLAARVRLRDELGRILRKVGTTSIMVTHDVQDARAFGDRTAILRSGKLEQIGAPESILKTPVNAYCLRMLSGNEELPED